MTLDEKIAKLKELDAKATPGEWEWGGSSDAGDGVVEEFDSNELHENGNLILMHRAAGWDVQSTDRDLIAFLRNNALPIIDELQAGLEAANQGLGVCGEKIDTYIDRRKEDEKRIEEMQAENERLRDDLNFYQVEAVARTNTDGRTKP